MKQLFIIISALGLLTVSACKKDSGSDNNNNTAKPADITGKTNQQIFMIQKWTLISWRDSSHAQDAEAITACSKDDTYEFKTTTSFTQNRGSVKCDPTELQTENYSWSMASASATKVSMFSYTYDIKKMTSEKIELRREFPVSGGLATQILVFEWSH